MEVFLLKDDVNLGEKGSLVKVSDGFARNFLFPSRIAKEANASMKKHVEAINKQRQKKVAKEKEIKAAEVKAIESKVYVLKIKVGEGGKLYGAVTHAQIAEIVTKESGLVIDKRKVHTEGPIKKAGEHEVIIKHYPELDAKIKIKIEVERTEEKEAE
ncbi:50S ribosomal protein L9 [Candidatus Margulisiibacteriota bacterium]